VSDSYAKPDERKRKKFLTNGTEYAIIKMFQGDKNLTGFLPQRKKVLDKAFQMCYNKDVKRTTGSQE
jgi:hypothetical protein